MKRSSFLQYESLISALLMDFQWIEMSLRLIVSASYDLLQKAAPPLITFKPNRGAVARDALGRLIERYSEVSLDVNAVKDLHVLLKERNFCAHQSFILSVDEQTDVNFLEQEVERLQVLKEETRDMVHRLQQEFNAVAKLLNETPSVLATRETTRLNSFLATGSADAPNDA